MKHKHKHKKSSFKKTFKLSRTVHIYLSSALFSLMLFFSFTGFTLNHASWFSSASTSELFTTELPADFNIDVDNPSIDQLQAYLK